MSGGPYVGPRAGNKPTRAGVNCKADKQAVRGCGEGARGRGGCCSHLRSVWLSAVGDVAPARPGRQGHRGGVPRQRGAARRPRGSPAAVCPPRSFRKRHRPCGSVHMAPPPDRREIHSRKVPRANRRQPKHSSPRRHAGPMPFGGCRRRRLRQRRCGPVKIADASPKKSPVHGALPTRA